MIVSDIRRQLLRVMLAVISLLCLLSASCMPIGLKIQQAKINMEFLVTIHKPYYSDWLIPKDMKQYLIGLKEDPEIPDDKLLKDILKVEVPGILHYHPPEPEKCIEPAIWKCPQTSLMLENILEQFGWETTVVVNTESHRVWCLVNTSTGKVAVDPASFDVVSDNASYYDYNKSLTDIYEAAQFFGETSAWWKSTSPVTLQFDPKEADSHIRGLVNQWSKE